MPSERELPGAVALLYISICPIFEHECGWNLSAASHKINTSQGYKIRSKSGIQFVTSYCSRETFANSSNFHLQTGFYANSVDY